MTESEWLACNDPAPMLEFLRGKASDRKLRLFACACWRRVWALGIDPRWRQAVDVAERFSDGLASREDLRTATDAEWVVFGATKPTIHYATADALRAARDAKGAEADAASPGARYGYDEYLAFAAVEISADAAQAALLRDLFGNPYRPITFDPAWLTWRDGAVKKMAQVIYDERRFADLPILADALEEAGCTNRDIFNHCRAAAEHVRGCWVVDLILGKE